MQILGHGVDIVVISRIERMVAEHSSLFLERIYTPDELRYCMDARRPAIRLSGRFAAKEAVLKVLGTGWRGAITFRDIETLPDELGKPYVVLHRATAKLAGQLGIDRILISISHAGDSAIASAIGVGG